MFARTVSFIFAFDDLDEEDFWLLEDHADTFRDIFMELLEAVAGEDPTIVLRKNLLREAVGLPKLKQTKQKTIPLQVHEDNQAPNKNPRPDIPKTSKKDTRDLFLDALCKLSGINPSFFFPSDGVGVDKASKFCSECEVSDLCLDHALANRIKDGVWGGASERERRRILRRRAQGSRSAAAS